MNFLENIKSFSYDNVSLKENDYTLINLDNNIISYRNTDKSDNDILSDLLECKAFATALLYLNENYILEVGKFKDIFTESGITVEDYYSGCNELLNKNIKIVEEIGIPLTEINGYKIFEGAGYILRGNGKKKIKESFSDEDLGDNAFNLPEYEFRALRFAERYGITDYKVDGNTMIYYEKHYDNVRDKKPTKYEYRVNLDTWEAGNGVPVNEDGTQASDIAPKVDQNMNKNVTTSKKKHYDILLSGLDEGLNILNKGFLKNSKGQYQRGNYILVKEGDKYLAIHKDKLNESNDYYIKDNPELKQAMDNLYIKLENELNSKLGITLEGEPFGTYSQEWKTAEIPVNDNNVIKVDLTYSLPDGIYNSIYIMYTASITTNEGPGEVMNSGIYASSRTSTKDLASGSYSAWNDEKPEDIKQKNATIDSFINTINNTIKEYK